MIENLTIVRGLTADKIIIDEAVDDDNIIKIEKRGDRVRYFYRSGAIQSIKIK